MSFFVAQRMPLRRLKDAGFDCKKAGILYSSICEGVGKRFVYSRGAKNSVLSVFIRLKNIFLLFPFHHQLESFLDVRHQKVAKNSDTHGKSDLIGYTP